MNSPILVIGALGNVGEAVVQSLQAKGQVVRAADINREKIKEKFGTTTQSVLFDFTNPDTHARTFEGIEKMFLMRPPHIANIKRDMLPVIQAAKKAGVKQVVFLSLIGIEKAKFVPHYKVEQALQELNFETSFLRCSFFMQNLNTTHRNEIKERNEIFVPVGNAKTSFVDVRDIGAVAAAVLENERLLNKHYDLTGSEALDYWQVAKIFSTMLERKIEYRNPNLLYFFIESIRRGAKLDFAIVTTGLYTSTRFGMADVVTDEAEKIIGRKPISFEQYVREYKKYWLPT